MSVNLNECTTENIKRQKVNTCESVFSSCHNLIEHVRKTQNNQLET